MRTLPVDTLRVLCVGLSCLVLSDTLITAPAVGMVPCK